MGSVCLTKVFTDNNNNVFFPQCNGFQGQQQITQIDNSWRPDLHLLYTNFRLGLRHHLTMTIHFYKETKLFSIHYIFIFKWRLSFFHQKPKHGKLERTAVLSNKMLQSNIHRWKLTCYKCVVLYLLLIGWLIYLQH